MPRSKRVLIIDDKPDFHSLYSRVLTEECHEVISVHSGEEASARLTYRNFDLIVLDLVLPPPGKSGIETLEAIRKIISETCVVITNAYSTTEYAVEAVIEKGAQTYIRKPFNIENVRQIVKNCLKWRKGLLPTAHQDVNVALG